MTMQDVATPRSSSSGRTSSESDRPLSEPLLRRLQERSLVCLPLTRSQGTSSSTSVVKAAPTAAPSFDDPDTEDNVFFESSRLVGATLLKAVQHITEPETITKGAGVLARLRCPLVLTPPYRGDGCAGSVLPHRQLPR